MTIHSEHPFLPPESERAPLRRLRGRLGGAVSLWTAGEGASRAGLTVSSVMVADGEPGHLLALVDPDSDLWPALQDSGHGVVQLLAWEHRQLADAFAGVAPAPGGPFRAATFEQTRWGPRLAGVSGWAGVSLVSGREVGWSVLVQVLVEHLEVVDEGVPLIHRRGRYAHPPG